MINTRDLKIVYGTLVLSFNRYNHFLERQNVLMKNCLMIFSNDLF